MRYEIRAMSFGEILDTGFRVVRNHFGLLVGIASLVYLPLALLTAVASIGPAVAASTALLVAAIPTILFALVAEPIVTAAATFAVGELYLGRSPSFADALRVSFAIILPLLGTSLLAWLCIAGGFVLLIVPGVYLAFAFILIRQIMVLERVFGVAALRRSRELMRGNLWRGAGILFVGVLIANVLAGVLQLALRFVPFIGPLATGLAQAASAAYVSTVGVLLYFDIRCRKEGFDVEHLARLVQAQGAPAGAAPLAPVS